MHELRLLKYVDTYDVNYVTSVILFAMMNIFYLHEVKVKPDTGLW